MRRVLALALILGLASPGALLADKKKVKKGRPDEGVPKVGFDIGEREKVKVYFGEAHGRGKCPPGLAKKGNGCLPPGLAKKRYLVGVPLAAEVRVLPVPQEVVVRIGPPPRGYTYGMIDGDLVKLAVGTLLVVDAIEGLVD